ncbi:MAG: PadR family transcriptional regulator [Clostridiales bacterium]|nr:PadR family transcriptional regulator [Clostridiales bacterium]
MAREQLKTLTESMYYILLTLLKPQHGYGIMQEVDSITKGRVKVGAGTLYNLLSRFEEEEIITQVVEDNRKKVYLISEKGLTILRAEHQRLNQLVEDGMVLLEEGRQSNET